jgi:hypothetical protein
MKKKGDIFMEKAQEVLRVQSESSLKLLCGALDLTGLVQPPGGTADCGTLAVGRWAELSGSNVWPALL